MDEFEPVLARIAEAVARANGACDAANATIARLAARLAEIKVGVECRVPISARSANDRVRLDGFGYGRSTKGSFVFYVAETRFDGQNMVSEYACVPWSNCGRAARLAAYAVLPALLQKIEDTVDGRSD